MNNAKILIYSFFTFIFMANFLICSLLQVLLFFSQLLFLIVIFGISIFDTIVILELMAIYIHVVKDLLKDGVIK